MAMWREAEALTEWMKDDIYGDKVETEGEVHGGGEREGWPSGLGFFHPLLYNQCS